MLQSRIEKVLAKKLSVRDIRHMNKYNPRGWCMFTAYGKTRSITKVEHEEDGYALKITKIEYKTMD